MSKEGDLSTPQPTTAIQARFGHPKSGPLQSQHEL